MSRYTHLKMPSEAMLRLDQQFFIELVKKMQLAHKHELNLCRDTYKDYVEKHLKFEVSKLNGLIKNWLGDLVKREDHHVKANLRMVEELENNILKLREAEKSIVEMKLYIVNLNCNM